MDSSPPPLPKKRRFFKDDLDDDPRMSTTSLSEVTPPTPISSDPPSPINPPTSANVDTPMTFAEQLLAILDEDLPPQVISNLEDASAGNIERAVNMYFDGSWESHVRDTKPVGLITTATGGKRPVEPTLNNFITKTISPTEIPRKRTPPVPVSEGSWARKYIGSLGVEGWAIASGNNLLKAGDPLLIERQTPPLPKQSKQSQSSKSSTQTSLKSKLSAPPSRFPLPSKQSKQHMLVRFTTLSGREIGRLPQETANFVSTLLDQNICSFDGICIFAPDRIRTGDNILIQLRAYLLPQVFKPVTGGKEDRPGVWEVSETEEERALKLRRVGLLHLFNAINLEPLRTDAMTRQTGNAREQLLQAVQLPDPKVAGMSRSSSSQSSPASGDDDGEGKEVAEDTLNLLYKKAQMYDPDMPTMDPPDTFKFELRKYQKQALCWMVGKESGGESDVRKQQSLNPLWEEYEWPKDDTTQPPSSIDDSSEKFYLNPYSGEMSLTLPTYESIHKGGILADGALTPLQTTLTKLEMGLGKTIEMLSLVHSLRAPRGTRNPTTLVIAPMSIISQWKSEADASSHPGTLKTLIYYGADKALDLPHLCSSPQAPDVIITSYGVVLSEWMSGKSAEGIFGTEWWRVILDEAHSIKNRLAKTARACYEIKATRRWVLTGTPIVNKLEDLFSLVHFLGVEPWSIYSYWRTFITVPFESKEYLRALDVVQTILEPLVLRRTKDMKDSEGNPIVSLPEKVIKKEYLEMSNAEREIYTYIYQRAKRSFTHAEAAGTIMKNYTTILSMLLRLRQSCCHCSLVKLKDPVSEPEISSTRDDFADDVSLDDLLARFKETGTQEEDVVSKYGKEVLSQIEAEQGRECPICAAEPMNMEAVTVGCWHMACRQCIIQHIEFQRQRGEDPICHTCRTPISETSIFDVIRHTSDIDNSAQITLQRYSPTQSTKLDALVRHLRLLKDQEPLTKSVVFSQFTSFLDIVERTLKREKIQYIRLDGTTSQPQRAAVLEKFSSHKGRLVLLISLKAGGVGLNLVAASRVFMLDPWWSFAIEAQAIDRIHRVGQNKSVFITRFIVKDSVEEKMLKIQDRKNFVASSLGMSKEEKQAATLEDIKTLFED